VNETYKALMRLVEQMNLIMRGVRGYGSGQPWEPHEPREGLGKSSMDHYIEDNDANDSDGDGEDDKEFEVSRAFGEREVPEAT